MTEIKHRQVQRLEDAQVGDRVRMWTDVQLVFSTAKVADAAELRAEVAIVFEVIGKATEELFDYRYPFSRVGYSTDIAVRAVDAVLEPFELKTLDGSFLVEFVD